MKLTHETERRLNEITESLTPKQQAFLRVWLLTSNVSTSRDLTSTTSAELDDWFRGKEFRRASKRVHGLRTQAFVRRLKKLVSAALKLAIEMSEEERSKYAKALDSWDGEDLDLLTVAGELARGRI